MSAKRALETAQRHFAASAVAAAQIDSDIIDAALFIAGPQWGVPATQEEIAATLDAFGFERVGTEIVRKKSPDPEDTLS